MIKFLKYYSLEIYTMVSLLLITYSSIFVAADTAQKIILVFTLLFVLHEWEENVYPGGFSDIMSGAILGEGNLMSIEDVRASRVYTGILLTALTFIPYFVHNITWLVLPAAFLGLWEGFIHAMAIKIFKREKPYTPGMVTAEFELVFALYVFWYLGSNGLATPIQYLWGVLIMVGGFVFMQRLLLAKNGIGYRTMISRMRGKKNVGR